MKRVCGYIFTLGNGHGTWNQFVVTCCDEHDFLSSEEVGIRCLSMYNT